MSSRLGIHEARNVTLVVMAIPITDGLPKDSFVKITSPEAYGTTQGLDGNVIRHRINDRIYVVELTLMASSEHNVQLAALHGIDATAFGGAGVGAFFLKDNSGTTLLAGEQCWIAQGPEIDYAEEPKDRVWTLNVVADPHTMIAGGL